MKFLALCIVTVFFVAECFAPSRTSPVKTVNDYVCTNKTRGFYGAPNNCSAFYFCDGNSLVAKELACPRGLDFNANNGSCDTPDNAKCRKAKRVEENFCLKKNNGLYENVMDCTTFYICSNHFTYLVDCPASLVFDSTLNVCNYRNEVPQCS